MTLGELIDALRSADPKWTVEHGFGEPMSYRGFYDEVAFAPCERTTVGEMLKRAESAVGATFTGYKGGEYRMDRDTQVWIAEYGRTVDEPFTRAALREMLGEPDEVDRLRAELSAVRQAIAQREEDLREAVAARLSAEEELAAARAERDQALAFADADAAKSRYESHLAEVRAARDAWERRHDEVRAQLDERRKNIAESDRRFCESLGDLSARFEEMRATGEALAEALRRLTSGGPIQRIADVMDAEAALARWAGVAR